MPSSTSAMTAEIPPRLLLNWLDANQHRAYPLDASTAGGNALIPYPLFVDAIFSVTENIDRARLYVSRLVVGDVSLKVFLSGYVDESSEDFGVIADIPLTTQRYTEIPVSVTTVNYIIAGTLVVGDMSSVSTVAADTVIPLESGQVFPGCVRAYPETTGIAVNGTVYTGVITLEAGDGIELSYSRDEETGEQTITISSTNYVIPEQNTYITSDSELVEEAVSIFGAPVRTINNQFPDDDGNINIVDPPPSSDSSGTESRASVQVEQAGYGAISITLSNDNTITTCDDDTTITVKGLMNSVADMNDRITAIDTAITALDKANSNLAIQLSRY